MTIFGQPDFGQARQRDDAHGHKGRGVLAPEVLPGFFQPFDQFFGLLQRLVAHQSRNGERHQTQNFAVFDGNCPAAALN